ncbi:MAG: Lrp/AsnC family transcriptional regulator [Myxococcota bacterium]
MTLDRIDLAILAALQNDARLSNKELADRVGLAPSTTLGRVRRLEEANVIRGASIDVDPAALGIALQALVVIRLGTHSRDTVRAIEAHLAARPEVVALWYIGGIDDFVVHVAVRDTRHLHDLLMDEITSRPEVSVVRTELVFEHVRRHVLPAYVTPDR